MTVPPVQTDVNIGMKAIEKDDEEEPVKLGDVNKDGAIDLKDVTSIRRYLAGGYGVTVDVNIADVTKDGKVDLKDVTHIRRYLAGGYGVEISGQ